MPDQRTQTFTVATDEVIAMMIRAASTRLVVVAPAVWQMAAEAICSQIEKMRAENVTVVLDSDPEVYRLGYGEIASLEQIQAAALKRGIEVRRQPGVRIGLVVADEQTLIFMPTPRLVEAGLNTHGSANAIRLGAPPRGMEADLGLTIGSEPQLGRSPLTATDVQTVKSDLEKNPPQKFDLARKVRVFNSFIEFVELEVAGAQLSRRTVPIPNHLLAVADPQTRERLEAKFRLIPPNDELSGKSIEKDKRLLLGPYLRVIPNYGTVILRRDRDLFDAALKKFDAAVQQFAERVRASIEERMNTNISELVESLLPALVERPPEEWIPSTRDRPNKDRVQALLEHDLTKAFGSAEGLVSEMGVRCLFKGVTYELLGNVGFIAAATKAIPEMKHLYEEFQAAQESRDPAAD